MNKAVIRFEKFCVKWAWAILSLLALFNLLQRIFLLVIPNMLFAFFYFCKFAGGSLKESLRKAEEELDEDLEDVASSKNRTRPGNNTLDVYFFPFIMLIATNLLIIFFFYADAYNWL